MNNPLENIAHKLLTREHVKEEFGEALAMYVANNRKLHQPIASVFTFGVQPYTLKYQNRRHTYVWSNSLLLLTSSDYIINVPPQVWTILDFPEGTKLSSTGGIAVFLCTDELIPQRANVDSSGFQQIGGNVFVNNPPISPIPTTHDNYNYTHINAAGTVVVKSGPGHLHTVSVNTIGATVTLTIYDNTAGSGSIIALITPDFVDSNIYDVAFNTGLTVVTTATTPGSYTLAWR